MVSNFVYLIGLFFLHPAFVAIAEEAAMGQVKEVTGLMKIKRAKQTTWLTAKRKTDVFFGDTITTGDDSQGSYQTG